MQRKKELIIIIIIVIITVFLAFLPVIINNESDNEAIEVKDNFIDVTITGEISYKDSNEITITVPSGVSTSYVINKVLVYFNEYSIIPCDNNLYYEDTTITILSSDIGNTIEGEIDGKIKISSATIDELVTLYGIGQARAKLIIEYRENNIIDSFEELKELIGVSDEVIEIIKEKAVL